MTPSKKFWSYILVLSTSVSALSWIEMGVEQTHTPYFSRMMLARSDFSKTRFDGDAVTSLFYLILGMANATVAYLSLKQLQGTAAAADTSTAAEEAFVVESAGQTGGGADPYAELYAAAVLAQQEKRPR